jgi:hypothetical protein
MTRPFDLGVSSATNRPQNWEIKLSWIEISVREFAMELLLDLLIFLALVAVGLVVLRLIARMR